MHAYMHAYICIYTRVPVRVLYPLSVAKFSIYFCKPQKKIKNLRSVAVLTVIHTYIHAYVCMYSRVVIIFVSEKFTQIYTDLWRL